MGFVKFNVDVNKKHQFENAFQRITKENDISWNQMHSEYHGNRVIIEIRESVIEKMNEDQISILNSFG